MPDGSSQRTGHQRLRQAIFSQEETKPLPLCSLKHEFRESAENTPKFNQNSLTHSLPVSQRRQKVALTWLKELRQSAMKSHLA